jgi:septal ring factor EnvC (AmiA/AmiB activator)
MENLSKYTPIELNKMLNDIKLKHDTLKQEIINCTYDAEELEKKINEKIKVLTEIENSYVLLIEEMEKR